MRAAGRVRALRVSRPVVRTPRYFSVSSSINHSFAPPSQCLTNSANSSKYPSNLSGMATKYVLFQSPVGSSDHFSLPSL